jgi:hypothetical protein
MDDNEASIEDLLWPLEDPTTNHNELDLEDLWAMTEPNNHSESECR